jgi:hypothetical protein
MEPWRYGDRLTDVPQDPIPIDPDRPHGITGDPQEVVEQPDLSFERVNEARWMGDVFGMRLAAVMLVRRRRRRTGQAVTPIPWIAIAATTGLAMILVVATWGLLRLAG